MKLFVLDRDKTEGQSPFSSIFETLLNLSVCLTYLFPRSAFTRFTRSQDARTSRACKEKKEGREEERQAASKRYPNSRLSSELGKVPNHIPQLFLKRRALALGSWMRDRRSWRPERSLCCQAVTMRLQISMRALEGKLSTNMANMEWHDIIGLDLQKTSNLMIEFPGSYFNVGLLSL